MTFISRRDLLRRAGAIGAAAAASRGIARATPHDGVPEVEAGGASATGPAELALQHHVREPLESLTAAEAELLDAIVARLIPTDASGPGATEARAVHYIDRALGGALAPGIHVGPRRPGPVLALVARQAVHRAVSHRPGLGAD